MSWMVNKLCPERLMSKSAEEPDPDNQLLDSI